MSWYEEHPSRSLELIRACQVEHDAPIIDIGGGTSALAAALVSEGFTDVTVADISRSALQLAEQRSGGPATGIHFVLADVRNDAFGRSFEVWHDRAMFHFMVSDEDRASYISTLRTSLRPGGHLLIATFGPQGPEQCSGLPTRRYDAKTLASALGSAFTEVSSGLGTHRTPSGGTQQFLSAHFLRGQDC
jgi:SAM-dependent methyltransferase